MSLAIIGIEVGALITARGLDLSKLSYVDGFNVEMALVFIPVVSYFIGRALTLNSLKRVVRAQKSLQKSLEPAQYEAEPEQRES